MWESLSHDVVQALSSCIDSVFDRYSLARVRAEPALRQPVERQFPSLLLPPHWSVSNPTTKYALSFFCVPSARTHHLPLVNLKTGAAFLMPDRMMSGAGGTVPMVMQAATLSTSPNAGTSCLGAAIAKSPRSSHHVVAFWMIGWDCAISALEGDLDDIIH
ncbi:hypothetical protein C2845_PM13G12480 [Panicum miliaceum]|uniref:Uncharacterized protein n=1 Tax=Panicum miliaceum TaxID=4540 RepID=A0A3L6RGJ9_PANMI|nr:hypothetical protein C2845_PM13G12480 [Panicum miliaceum]